MGDLTVELGEFNEIVSFDADASRAISKFQVTPPGLDIPGASMRWSEVGFKHLLHLRLA
jgi:hypothetical protein